MSLASMTPKGAMGGPQGEIPSSTTNKSNFGQTPTGMGKFGSLTTPKGNISTPKDSERRPIQTPKMVPGLDLT